MAVVFVKSYLLVLVLLMVAMLSVSVRATTIFYDDASVGTPEANGWEPGEMSYQSGEEGTYLQPIIFGSGATVKNNNTNLSSNTNYPKSFTGKFVEGNIGPMQFSLAGYAAAPQANCPQLVISGTTATARTWSIDDDDCMPIGVSTQIDDINDYFNITYTNSTWVTIKVTQNDSQVYVTLYDGVLSVPADPSTIWVYQGQEREMFLRFLKVEDMSPENISCSPSWSCSSFGGCHAGNLKDCLNVTDSNNCSVSFNGTLSSYNASCVYTPSGGGGGYAYIPAVQPVVSPENVTVSVPASSTSVVGDFFTSIWEWFVGLFS